MDEGNEIDDGRNPRLNHPDHLLGLLDDYKRQSHVENEENEPQIFDDQDFILDEERYNQLVNRHNDLLLYWMAAFRSFHQPIYRRHHHLRMGNGNKEKNCLGSRCLYNDIPIIEKRPDESASTKSHVFYF